VLKYDAVESRTLEKIIYILQVHYVYTIYENDQKVTAV